MSNIFVVTASNQAAQEHITKTIENPIPIEQVEPFFSGSELEQILKIPPEDKYFAWGAIPGEKNIPTWERMKTGDHILIYQNKAYTYHTSVLFKARNRAFAIENWGKDDEGETWEYIYLLKMPVKLKFPIKAIKLSKYLPASYRGFMQITNDRISQIVSDYGSIDNYLSKELPKLDNIRATNMPNFWWVCQGRSYEIGRREGYIWAPNKDRGGGLPAHWASMSQVEKGDIVFNYANTFIKAISIVKGKSYDYKNESAIDNWQTTGQRIDLDYYDIEPIDISSIQSSSNEIVTAVGLDNAPLNRAGGVKQGYLFNFSFNAAKIIRAIYNKPFPPSIEKYFGVLPLVSSSKSSLIKAKKQIILYGPPGTGKTYMTKHFSVSLIKGDKDA